MPILLDLSSNTSAEVLGETFVAESQEPFYYHLKWDLSGVKAVDLSGILYGDSDSDTGKLFWQHSASVLEGETTSRQGVDAFVSGLLKPLYSGNSGTSNDNAGLKHKHATGKQIPLVSNTSTGNTLNNAYSSSITGTDADNQSVGGALLRVMSTHLMGHPLGQTFISNDSAFVTGADSAILDLSANFIRDLSGAHGSTNMDACLPEDKVLKADGTDNVVFRSMLEQLLAADTARFEGLATDVSGNAAQTTPQRMPFQAGDTIVFYLRVKARLNVEAQISVPSYGGIDSSGNYTGDAANNDSNTNVDSSASSVGVISSVFPGQKGAVGDASRFGWMGDPSNSFAVFSQTGTDVTEPSIFDAHVWRISCTLK